MAGSDYAMCNVCERKVFYDADTDIPTGTVILHAECATFYYAAKARGRQQGWAEAIAALRDEGRYEAWVEADMAAPSGGLSWPIWSLHARRLSGVSSRAASWAASCSTRSAAPARLAWSQPNTAGASSASTCPRRTST